MSQYHAVVIIPFIKGGRRYLVVKSNIPENTSLLIQGSAVEEVMNSFFARYGHEILSSIRMGRNVFVFLAEPNDIYWICVNRMILQEELKGCFNFYPLLDLEYVEREITIACQHAIIPVPP